MVRATRSTRCRLRAVSCRRSQACSSRRWPSSASRQSRMMPALSRRALSRPARSSCRACAAITRSRMAALDSPGGASPRSACGGRRAIARCRSMRSSSGPEIRPQYWRIRSGLQRHREDGSPAQPQGHGFIAATSWKRAGNSALRPARATVMRPDSSGSRSTSSTARCHSGSSSRNSTPLCASEISPGRGGLPPPASAAALAPWCGARHGRCRHSRGSKPRPLIEATAAVSSASASVASGSRPGRRDASRVLPQPGGPLISRWWPPAAAISSARRAWAWPRTSAMSGADAGAAAGSSPPCARGNAVVPPSPAQVSSRVRAT